MTNEEQLAFNRSFLKVWCRGPRRIHGDRLRAINAKRNRLLDERDLGEMRILATELNALLSATELPVPSSGIEAWNLAVVKLMDLRIPCGEDVSEKMSAGPYDGQLRSFPCPSCGTEQIFRPALSGEEAAKVQGVFQDSLDKLGD